MKKGEFIFNGNPDDILELTKSILNGLKIDKDIVIVSDKILSLDFSEQLYVIFDIVRNFYDSIENISDRNIGIQKFLSQKIFKDHIEILQFLLDYTTNSNIKYQKEKIKLYEEKFNIKIIV